MNCKLNAELKTKIKEDVKQGRKIFFDCPTQGFLIDEDEDEMLFGIFYQEVFICCCCGGIYELDKVSEDCIYPLESWCNLNGNYLDNF